MDRNMKDILDTVNFIKDNMATKSDIAELDERLSSVETKVGSIDDRLFAVENKVSSIHNRLDEEMLRRNNLEDRVRSVLPDLPARPQLI